MTRTTLSQISNWFDVTCTTVFGAVTVAVGFGMVADPARITQIGLDPVGSMILACGAWVLIQAVGRTRQILRPTNRYRVVDVNDPTVHIPVDSTTGTFTIEDTRPVEQP